MYPEVEIPGSGLFESVCIRMCVKETEKVQGDGFTLEHVSFEVPWAF